MLFSGPGWCASSRRVGRPGWLASRSPRRLWSYGSFGCGPGFFFPVWFAVGRRAIPAAGGVDIVTVSVVLGPSETVPMSGLGDCTLCRLVCPGGPGC